MEHGALSAAEQKEIIRRRLICASCKFNSSNAVSDPLLGYKTDRLDEHCILCKCNIDLKTASLSSECGIEIHNYNNPKAQMELKWTVFKPKQ